MYVLLNFWGFLCFITFCCYIFICCFCTCCVRLHNYWMPCLYACIWLMFKCVIIQYTISVLSLYLLLHVLLCYAVVLTCLTFLKNDSVCFDELYLVRSANIVVFPCSVMCSCTATVDHTGVKIGSLTVSLVFLLVIILASLLGLPTVVLIMYTLPAVK